MNVQGKEILLLAPDFYGYDRLIRQSLQNAGACVTLVDNKAFNTDPKIRGNNMRWLSWMAPSKAIYQRRILKTFSRRFDYFICINLFSFHPSQLQMLRKHNPDIVTRLYLWDNLSGYSWTPWLALFDRVFSFDPGDARQYNLECLPNFHIKQGAILSREQFDYSFIGSFQMQRLRVLQRLAKEFDEMQYRYCFRLVLSRKSNALKYNFLLYAVARLLPDSVLQDYKESYEIYTGKRQYDFVTRIVMPLREVHEVIAGSKCVIDMSSVQQSGLSQRIIDALAYRKKILTTNTGIRNETFYNEDCVRIINIDKPDLHGGWIDSPVTCSFNLDHLHLDTWLERLLGHEELKPAGQRSLSDWAI